MKKNTKQNMSCKECGSATITTREEVEVCKQCGLVQEYFPIICTEVEKYVSARAEYNSFDSFLEFEGGSVIGTSIQYDSNTRSTLLQQQKQQSCNNKKTKIARYESIVKAICYYNHFSENILTETIIILKSRIGEKQFRKINKSLFFGACIFQANAKILVILAPSPMLHLLLTAQQKETIQYPTMKLGE